MKILRLVLPAIIYGILLYLCIGWFENSDYPTSNALFVSGIVTVLLYSTSFLRKGGLGLFSLGYGRTGGAAYRSHTQGAMHTMAEAERIKQEQERSTNDVDYTKYRKSLFSGREHVVVAFGIGLISIIISFFTY